MFDMENAVREWKRTLLKLETFEDGFIAELESHLRDGIDRLKEKGLSDEAAFNQAVSQIGRPETIGGESFKTKARFWASPPTTVPGRSSAGALAWNGFKTAYRLFRRQKGYSFINVAGLAVGLAACLLILLWVKDELSYDRFHAGVNTVYRLYLEDRLEARTAIVTATPFPLAEALKKEFPEVVAAGRTYRSQFQIRHGDKLFNEGNVCFADPGLFACLSFPSVRGDAVRALGDPGAVVLSEETARKIFGGENPLGRSLTLDAKTDFSVAAVVRVPANTDVGFAVFLPMNSLPRFGQDLAGWSGDWRARNFSTFIRLADGTSADAFAAKISEYLKTKNPGRNEVLRLQPVSRIHLYRPDGTAAGMKDVRTLSTIAAFILLLACVNFINLATARAGKRAREVGLRKTIGARRAQIVRQFFAESVFLAFLSLGLALIIIGSALPAFNALTGKTLTLDFSDPVLYLGLGLAVLVAGTLSGLYPAVFLSGFKPAAVLKGRNFESGRGSAIRKGLIIFQFAVSLVLIVSAAVIASQIRFLRSRDIGFDRSRLVYAYMMGDNRNNAEALKAELARYPAFFEGASACNNLPTQILYNSSVDWEGRASGEDMSFPYVIGDFDYVKTFGMTITRGRDFSRDIAGDEDRFIVNEEAVRQMGLSSPLGTRLRFMRSRWGEIIGVVRDFNFQSMRVPVRPLIITPKGSKRFFIAKMKPGDPEAAVRIFRNAWNRINPGFLFEGRFVDEAFDRIYGSETRLGKIVTTFSLLAVFVSCLGLFGLAAYTAERKTREIGIRKVLGASVAGIVGRLNREFAILVLLANLIAWPVAYLAMKSWLRSFAYRIPLNPILFLAAALLAALIAGLTVSIQTIRAATADPVKSLKHE